MRIETAVLGAEDPEMWAIEGVLRGAGVHVEYAAIRGADDGVIVRATRRVWPGDAYRANCVLVPDQGAAPLYEHDDRSVLWRSVLWVECAPAGVTPTLRADHHREGDPGFGRPPAEFWKASSLGQVVAALWPQLVEAAAAQGIDLHEAMPSAGVVITPEARSFLGLAAGSIPETLALIAAADHCLAAALQGACPGVDPDALLDWRLTAPGSPHTSEPDGQGGRRPVPLEVVRERALLARYMLAPGYNLDACRLVAGVGLVTIGGTIAVDLRAFGSATVGLPLADVACRLGLAYVLRVPDAYRDGQPFGRQKLVLGGCGEGSAPGVVPMAAWESWCRDQGYTGEIYGDPARGYAGCYLAPREAQS